MVIYVLRIDSHPPVPPAAQTQLFSLHMLAFHGSVHTRLVRKLSLQFAGEIGRDAARFRRSLGAPMCPGCHSGHRVRSPTSGWPARTGTGLGTKILLDQIPGQELLVHLYANFYDF